MDNFKDAFVNILMDNNPDIAIKDNFDYLCTYIPELKAMEHFNQFNPHHLYDVLTHTLVVVKNTPKDLTLRLSALFHDIGKPSTFFKDEKGIGHFYGHEHISVKIAKKFFQKYEFPSEVVRNTLKLIEYHDYPIYAKEKALQKLILKIGPDLIKPLFILKKADISGQSKLNSDRLAILQEAEKILSTLNGKMGA